MTKDFTKEIKKRTELENPFLNTPAVEKKLKTGNKQVNKPVNTENNKTIKQYTKKENRTFSLKPESYEKLRAHAFKTRQTQSEIIDTLIESLGKKEI